MGSKVVACSLWGNEKCESESETRGRKGRFRFRQTYGRGEDGVAMRCVLRLVRVWGVGMKETLDWMRKRWEGVRTHPFCYV